MKTKNCKICKKIFTKNPNLSLKAWQHTQYCSRKCVFNDHEVRREIVKKSAATRLLRYGKFDKKKYDKEYYEKNKIQIHVQQKEYNKKYRLTIERKKSWYEYGLTPKHFFYTLRTNILRKGMVMGLTKEEFVDWYNKTEKICFYCGIPEQKLKDYSIFNIFHKKNQHSVRLTIDRMDNTLSYELGNIVFACSPCNRVKNNILTANEMKEIAQKYIKPKWNK